jgi:hypothetical protein
MDLPTAHLLQEIVRRESLSLLSYVGDAFPWTSRGNNAALAQLRLVVAEHKKAVLGLGKMLTRHRMTPSFGSFPSNFTSINFLGLGYILTRLVEAERPALALLESEAARVTDAESRAALGHFVTLKRDHLSRLEALANPPSASAPTPAAS